MLDKGFFIKIAPNVTARFREFIFGSTTAGRSAKQVTGKAYPNYSPDYAEEKSKGTGKRQSTEFSNSKAPVFTGDLMKDFSFHKLHQHGFRFGTSRGGVVKNLAARGRVIATNTKPLPDKVVKYILSEANRYVDKELSKIPSRKFDI